MSGRRVRAFAVAGIAFSTSLAAQGASYAFDERAAKSPIEKLVDAKLPSLVKVHGASGLSTITPYATGVLVSAQGHVLTLDLVMVQKDQTRVVLFDGSVHDAKLLPPDGKLGLRLLKIDPTALDFALQPVTPRAADELPANGTFVISIGNCFRLAEFSEKLSATFGVITAKARTGLRYRLSDVDYDGELLLTDAANNPGHFGGALFDLDGNWIGLNARLVESTETNTLLSAAIPTRDVQAYLDRWIRADGAVSTRIVPDEPDDDAPGAEPGYHGIELFDRGGRQSPPAYVERVRRRSPAREAGLKPDDLIVRVGDRPVRTCAEFEAIVGALGPDTTIQLVVKRGEKVFVKELTLGRKPK